MRHIISIAFVFGFAAVTLVSFKPFKIMKKDGAAPGYTGSPGDSLKNCTACHGGQAVPVNGWITSNIPSSGYVPGETYTIITTNTEAEGTRFGFEISPQDVSGKLLGTMVITDTVQTKLVGADKYITYTANGVEGLGYKTWTFDWVAPAAGTGDVTFYGGFNSNFNGHKEGDKTFLSNLTVKEFGTTDIKDFPAEITVFHVYPNPANDKISIKLELKETAKLRIDIIDYTGKKVAVIHEGKSKGSVLKEYNTSALPNGNYFIRIQINGKTAQQQISVGH